MSVRSLLVVATLLLAGSGLLFLFGGGGAKADFDDGLVALDDAAQIERGRYLAIAGNCASCHTTAEGGFLAGGLPFETPFGRIYSTNITPDRGTGIGAWSADEFFASMRYGERPGGEHLYPVFPYTAFTRITDEDIAALYSYLMSVPALRQETPANDMPFPFSQRALMGPWKRLFFEPGAFTPETSRSEDWNRGAYLVEALAHCSACHSPRNRLGAEKTGLAMSGGVYTDRVRTGVLRPWSAPNLTAAHSGLGIWPREELAAYLKTGRNRFVETHGPMNEVIMNSTRHLSEADVGAMSAYLKSLPAIEYGDGPEADARTLGMGRTLYNLHCGTCHLPTGRGDPEMAPQIGGGSLVARAGDPASLINVILYGPEPPDPPLPPKWRNPMEEFQYLLDDDEVAALASFLRHSWDNGAALVTPEQVARQR